MCIRDRIPGAVNPPGWFCALPLPVCCPPQLPPKWLLTERGPRTHPQLRVQGAVPQSPPRSRGPP
eukprot:334000-Alexandrium_andersonii.AAC.1